MNKFLAGMKKAFPLAVSPGQAKDTGMAMVLICLLLYLFIHIRFFLILSVLLLVVDMVWPGFFRPGAVVWFGFSRLFGTFVSKIVFAAIFVFLVVPVGLLRRLLGKDSLQLKKWKRGCGSVLRVRDHPFVSVDIAHPY